LCRRFNSVSGHHSSSFRKEDKMNHPPNILIRKTLIFLSAALIASLLSYFLLDQKIAAFFGREDLVWLWLIARNITDAGEAGPYLLGSLLSYGFFRWVKPQYPQWRRWSIHFFQCLIYLGILIQLLKKIIGRQRPHKTETFEADIFVPFNNHWDWASMPSGHAQVCFVVATMFSLAFPKYKALFFVVFGILAFTRVMTYSHFLSDVIMGSVIAYLGTLWVMYFLAERNKAKHSA
jgi:membrane-associated phospholipid phosphatase